MLILVLTHLFFICFVVYFLFWTLIALSLLSSNFLIDSCDDKNSNLKKKIFFFNLFKKIFLAFWLQFLILIPIFSYSHFLFFFLF